MNSKFKTFIFGLSPYLFYALLFFCIASYGFSSVFLDYDLWARLINGSHVLQYGTPAFNDMISYTPTHVWIDPEWISSALLYFVAHNYGLNGLIFLKIFFTISLFCLLVFSVGKLYPKECKYNFGYFLFVLVIYIQTAYLSHVTRCQLITFVILAIWVYFLEKIRQGKNLYLYIMPFLMLIWLNLHGACIAGVGLLFVYAVGEALNKKPFKKYIYLLFGLIFVFMINPWGIQYLKFMFDSAILDRSWIGEWLSPVVVYPIKKFYFALYAFLIWFSYFYYIFKNKIKFKEVDKVRLILLFLMSYLAFKHLKHIGLALVTYTILFYETYFYTYNSLMEILRKYLDISKDAIKKIIVLKKISVTILTFVFFGIFSAFNLYTNSYLKNFENNYPYFEMEFLKANNIKGKILTQFEYGSFIGYNYGPDYKIFIDGRQEQVYDSSILDELMFFIMNLGPDPLSILKKYQPDIVLLNNFFLNSDMDSIPEYSKIYSKRGYTIYVLNKHKKDKYIYPIINTKKYINNLFSKGFEHKDKSKK